MRYLAVDIGASSGRHIVAELVDGKLVLEEVYRFTNGADAKDGRLYWDTERLFREIVNGLKRAKEVGKQPDYMGIDTWAVDYVLIDESGKALPTFSYRDKRGSEIKDKAHSVMTFEELYSRSGIQYQPFNTIYQLYDDVLSGKMAKAKSFLMLPDYFNYLLTGVKKQEYTNATSTGMVNAKTHKWDEDIIKAFGFKAELFGELSQPSTVVGKFSESVSREIGYSATVLLPATHDTASAVLAAPLKSAAPYISSGTWSLLGIECDEAHTDADSRKYNYSNEGSIDYQFRYQKNIMGLWMIQQARKEWNNAYSFAELVEMARKDTTDITVDVNSDKFLAPESMLKAIYEETGEMSVGKTAYCIFNSLAKCYAQSIEELEKLLGKEYDTLNIIGGGCQNGLLNELTAKATKKRIFTGPTESTAIGNIIMQMIGAGELRDLRQARDVVRKSFKIEEVK